MKYHKVILKVPARVTFVIDQPNQATDVLCFPCVVSIFKLLACFREKCVENR